ncbi:MAG: hypothetical protein D8H97_16190 [Neisseria sp.]|nr:MAG: hypothetical protein D8H97_16190 [Neisseria sp.]
MIIALQDSENNTSFTNIITSVTIATTDLKAGAQYVMPLPAKHRRYIRAYYIVTGSMTAGKINAAIVSGLQNNEPMPESRKVWSEKK